MKSWPFKWMIVVTAVILLVATPSLRGDVDYHKAMTIIDAIPPKRNIPRPNAFDDFLAASKSMVRDKEVYKALPPFPAKRLKPGEHRWTTAERKALLKANRVALNRMREGLKYDYAEPDLDPITQENPLIGVQKIAGLLALDSEVRLERGDLSGFARSDLDAILIGAKIERANTIIGMKSGISCQKIGHERLWKNFDRLKNIDAKSARLDALELETAADNIFSLPDIMRGEERLAISCCRYYYNHPEHFPIVSALESMDGNSETEKNMHTATHQYARFIILGLLLSYVDNADLFIKNGSLPYSKHQPVPDLPLLVTKIYIPSFDSLTVSYFNNSIQNAFISATLALLAYKKERGDYPASLSELVPRYLHHLPVDPFNDGKPLLYRKRGKDYLLYSIGPDARDDGGNPIDYAKDEGKEKTSFFRYGIRTDSRGDIVAGINIY